MTDLLTITLGPWIWVHLRRFGAFAFFPLSLLDLSLVPVPGSLDVLLILLTAAHKDLWWYYALMAVAGSVLGAWACFNLGRKMGEETLTKRMGAQRASKVFSVYRRWGSWSIFAGAVAPPPMPATALVLTAGALDYPWRNFLLSWCAGRALRYVLLAWLTMRYGSHLFFWLEKYYVPALWTLIGFAFIGGGIGLWFYLRERKRANRASKPTARVA